MLRRTLASLLILLLLGGGAWAVPFGWHEITEKGGVSYHDRQKLLSVLGKLITQELQPQGPGQIEQAEVYMHEMIRDESLQHWIVFQSSPVTIIPHVSARFYIYHNLAVDQLKKPSLNVYMVSPKSGARTKKTLFDRLKKVRRGLRDVGLVKAANTRSDDRGWNVFAIFVQPDPVPGLEREWDWWLVAQKFLFVAAVVAAGLVFIEVLRGLFGAGAKAIGQGRRRRSARLRHR